MFFLRNTLASFGILQIELRITPGLDQHYRCVPFIPYTLVPCACRPARCHRTISRRDSLIPLPLIHCKTSSTEFRKRSQPPRPRPKRAPGNPEQGGGILPGDLEVAPKQIAPCAARLRLAPRRYRPFGVPKRRSRACRSPPRGACCLGLERDRGAPVLPSRVLSWPGARGPHRHRRRTTRALPPMLQKKRSGTLRRPRSSFIARGLC